MTLRASRWRRHPHFGAFGLFVLVIGGIYWPVLDGTRSLITNGPWSQPIFVIDALAGGPTTAPLTRLAAAAWLHLQLPIFDPFQGFGIPLLSDQGVPVYPPQVIAHLLFPGNYSIWLVVNLMALAFGVYLLARAFGQGFCGAMAAGFLAALAGAAPPNVNMTMLNPLAVLPFVLVAIRYAVDPKSTHRRAGLLGVATSVALLCLSGFQEVLPLMAAVIVVYTVALLFHFEMWRVRPLSIVSAAVAAVGGAIIGCVGILPTLSVVSSGTSLNGPTSYLGHFPFYWLSTLLFPTITGRSLNQAPVDLGNTVSTLGTPILALVVVLGLVVALRRRGAHTRWYVFPSVVLVVLGLLAYADVGHVLQLMDVPLFDQIRSDRFVQFGWWIPLCLLAGAVVSNARVLTWRDALLGLVVAGAVDAYFFARFLQALAASHVARNAAVDHAAIVAAVVVVLVVGLVVAARWLGNGVASLLLALVVLASCIYDVPRNFAPGAYDGAVASVSVPGWTGSAGQQLVYFGTRQLPTQQYSVQIYGPILSKAYTDVLSGLFSATQTKGLGPTYGAVATLAELTVTPRAVLVLRSLGVDLLVLSSPLAGAGFTSVPTCSSGATSGRGDVCYLGKAASPAPSVGYAPTTVYAYRVAGAHVLVEPDPTLVTVGSTTTALQRLSASLSTSATRLPATAYVTTSAGRLRAARGVRGVSRHSTTEQVSVAVHATRAGMAVVRESYEAGMRATVDGQSEPTLPVDGGLWTAVHVGTGTSQVVLDYASTADLVEFGIGEVGLAALAVAWIGLGVGCLWRRRRRRRAQPDGAGAGTPETDPAASRAPAGCW